MRLTLPWAKIIVSLFLLSAVLLLMQVGVSGEQTEPRPVLLRLEDVGPGGEYGTLEQLGKLRAVLEYLQNQGIHYQIGVIPKWVNYSDEGLTYSKSIGETDDPYIRALTGLLQDAVKAGAAVGMHGYTHQTGERKRADGHQESGIGNEFNVENEPETAAVDFAEVRVEEGMKLFQTAGLKPAFWETPHYHSTVEQHRVFRSYFGIIYEYHPEQPGQPNLLVNPQKNVGFQSPSWGAAYVPTPFSYIAYNRDEKQILDQLGKPGRLPSFFYHAFLEFKHLVPVLGDDGEPVIRNGLPDYRYPDKPKSNLQKLIIGLKERGYSFYALHDYVPFVPSVRLEAQAKAEPQEASTSSDTSNMSLGDATGDGQLDRAVWKAKTGQIIVFPGQYRGYVRNEAQPEGKIRGQLFPAAKGTCSG